VVEDAILLHGEDPDRERMRALFFSPFLGRNCAEAGLEGLRTFQKNPESITPPATAHGPPGYTSSTAARDLQSMHVAAAAGRHAVAEV